MGLSQNYVSVLIGQSCLHKDKIKVCIDVFRNAQDSKYVKLVDDYGREELMCSRHFLRCRKRLQNNVILPKLKYDELLEQLNVIF